VVDAVEHPPRKHDAGPGIIARPKKQEGCSERIEKSLTFSVWVGAGRTARRDPESRLAKDEEPDTFAHGLEFSA